MASARSKKKGEPLLPKSRSGPEPKDSDPTGNPRSDANKPADPGLKAPDGSKSASRQRRRTARRQDD